MWLGLSFLWLLIPFLCSVFLVFNYNMTGYFLLVLSLVFVYCLCRWRSIIFPRFGEFSSMTLLEIFSMLLIQNYSPFIPIIHRFLSFYCVPNALHVVLIHLKKLCHCFDYQCSSDYWVTASTLYWFVSYWG